MNKFLILFLIFISLNAIGNDDLHDCNIESTTRLCKTGLEVGLTDLLHIKKNRKLYRGKHIILAAQNIKANLLFRKIADFSGYSLLMDAKINREISIKETKVPWDQAIDKLAESLHLKVKVFNHIIYVDTPDSLRKYKPRKKTYSGSPVSLSFKDIKASFLFNVLADFSGNSLLIDANIDRKISIQRDDIPWDQVLDEVAEFLNLKAKVSNGIIYVDTPISLWKYQTQQNIYNGSALSLNFLSIKIEKLFKILAEFSGHTFVVKPKINSEISIRRNDIPWDQALNEITEFLELKAVVSNGTIYIDEKKVKILSNI